MKRCVCVVEKKKGSSDYHSGLSPPLLPLPHSLPLLSSKGHKHTHTMAKTKPFAAVTTGHAGGSGRRLGGREVFPSFRNGTSQGMTKKKIHMLAVLFFFNAVLVQSLPPIGKSFPLVKVSLIFNFFFTHAVKHFLCVAKAFNTVWISSLVRHVRN